MTDSRKGKDPLVLIVDDEEAIGRSIGEMLRTEGFMVRTEVTAGAGLEAIRKHHPDILLCDIRLPDRSGIEVLAGLRELSPHSIAIMMTAYATVENAIDALKLGASDYLFKPILFDDLLYRIRHLLEHRRLEWQSRYLRRSLNLNSEQSSIIGESAPIRRVRELIQRIGPTPSTVLVTGESGSGKDLIAAELHRNSQVAKGPFLAINCSAIPESLLESELFGYRKGAFSGADSDKQGIMELAHRGTLFLDEIGDLPLALQPKLLRAIEAKEFLPLGSTTPVTVDTRVVVATNRPLSAMVEEGSFRKDLYYRLSLLEITAPRLRDCAEDIPRLVTHFLNRLNLELGREVRGVEAATLAEMSEAEWPGNVRELENRLRRAMILSDADLLHREHLWEDCAPESRTQPTLKEAVHCFEIRMIRNVIQQYDGDKRAAATALGVSIATLYSKLRDHGLDPDAPPTGVETNPED